MAVDPTTVGVDHRHAARISASFLNTTAGFQRCGTVECEGVDLHRTLGERRQTRKVLRVDVIGKNESRRRLIADHGHDIGLTELIVHEPAIFSLRFEQFQPDDRLLGQSLEHRLQLMAFRAEAFVI